MASEESQVAQQLHRRALHSKRSFRHGLAVDSPLYDASEEDNDETGDDTASTRQPSNSSPSARLHPTSPLSRSNVQATSKLSKASKVYGPAIVASLESDGVDSPTYDGDIESSTTAAPTPSASLTKSHHSHHHMHQLSSSTFAPDSPNSPYFPGGAGAMSSSASTSTASSVAPSAPVESTQTPQLKSSLPLQPQAHVGSPPPVEASVTPFITISSTPRTANPPDERIIPRVLKQQAAEGDGGISHNHHQHHELAKGEPEPVDVTMDMFDPSALTPAEIQKFVKDALDGTGDIPRKYKPNPPPTDRPVRIYADGVYDIFHFGHSLQLRQAKLSFPSVHLLVGVCSDLLCQHHKSRTVMSHAERCESVRHCRWVDEVLSDAPWVIDQEFLDKHQIDYVAHDEDPYKGSDGSDDVYDYVKRTGHFVPTRRTPGVSTSELLERIVTGYRDYQWDAKLEKMGHPELKAEGSEFGSRAPSRAPSRAASRPASRLEVNAG